MHFLKRWFALLMQATLLNMRLSDTHTNNKLHHLILY